MILDASALVAIALNDPGATLFIDAIAGDGHVAISASTLLEASIVIDARRNPIVSRRFDEVLQSIELEVVPFTVEQARIARQAYRDYGRGSGHPAQLNYGDCFSYALATERREPLLFAGKDFAQTDIRSAV